jgi:plasmid stabilization system protein ParE
LKAYAIVFATGQNAKPIDGSDIFIRPLAWREITRELEYLRDQAGTETAERFLDQFIVSCETLARMPRMAPVTSNIF